MVSRKPGNVKRAAAEGTAITGLVIVLLRVINFVAALYLLRILDPSDFGVVALAMLVVSAFNLFSDLGMGPALVHSDHDRRTAAYQAFVTSTLFSSSLSLLVYFNAQWLANFLDAPDVAPVIEWMSLYIVVGSLSTIPFSLLRKEMSFKQVGLVTFVSVLTVTIVQVVLAFLGFGLWSLVAGQIAGVAMRVFVSWWLCPGWDWIKPGRWDWKVHRDLMRFGIPTTGSGLLSYCNTNFDDWIVGRYLGTTALGFYSKAYDLTHKTTNRIARNVVGVVFFPMYAKISSDKARLSRAYVKSLSFILIIMTPLAFGTFVLVGDLVRILFGEKWLPMVPVMQIYAIVIFMRPISENSSPLFMSLGKPNYNLHAGLVLLVCLVPLSVYWLPHGIAGVASAVAVAHFFGMAFNVYQANRLLPGTAKQSVGLMLVASVNGLMMAVAMVAAKYALVDNSAGELDLLGLILVLLAGAACYCLAIFVTQRVFLQELLELVVSMLRRRTRSKRNKA